MGGTVDGGRSERPEVGEGRVEENAVGLQNRARKVRRCGTHGLAAVQPWEMPAHGHRR